MSRTQIAVVGLGRFGSYLVEELCKLDVEVLAIDKSSKKIQEISKICDDSLRIDVNEEETVRDYIKNVDILIVTVRDNPLPAILLTTVAHDLGIKRIIVRAHDQTSKTILKKLGATEIFSPEAKAAKSMAKNLTVPNFAESLPLSNQQSIIKINPPASWVGRTISEVAIRQNYAVNLLCKSDNHGESYDFSPEVDKPFAETDLIYLLGSTDRLSKLDEKQ